DCNRLHLLNIENQTLRSRTSVQLDRRQHVIFAIEVYLTELAVNFRRCFLRLYLSPVLSYVATSDNEYRKSIEISTTLQLSLDFQLNLPSQAISLLSCGKSRIKDD
ncbi:hypothetical protein PROFUN_14835, partial [Planoprotostelium fungivorum]